MAVSTTALTVADFCAKFPAFQDIDSYGVEEIAMYLAVADAMLTPRRWPEPFRTLGMGLFAAHQLILSKRDQNVSEAGGVPGAASGIVSSKSVGGVSISYDTSSGLEQGAGAWNLTPYGTRFYRLLRLVGMGGTQLGGPDLYLNDSFGPAWPGVIYPKW